MNADTCSKKRIYVYENARFESFKFWPFDDALKCNKRAMAEAGFFWSGSEQEQDSATCFICSKQLDNWESHDNPWHEHKMHAPNCVFVMQGKKESQLTVEEFINLFEHCYKANTNQKKEAMRYALQQSVDKLRDQLYLHFKR